MVPNRVDSHRAAGNRLQHRGADGGGADIQSQRQGEGGADRLGLLLVLGGGKSIQQAVGVNVLIKVILPDDIRETVAESHLILGGIGGIPQFGQTLVQHLLARNDPVLPELDIREGNPRPPQDRDPPQAGNILGGVLAVIVVGPLHRQQSLVLVQTDGLAIEPR